MWVLHTATDFSPLAERRGDTFGWEVNKQDKAAKTHQGLGKPRWAPEHQFVTHCSGLCPQVPRGPLGAEVSAPKLLQASAYMGC